eukprot:2184824-Rhodomonas_salina.2
MQKSADSSQSVPEMKIAGVDFTGQTQGPAWKGIQIMMAAAAWDVKQEKLRAFLYRVWPPRTYEFRNTRSSSTASNTTTNSGRDLEVELVA